LKKKNVKKEIKTWVKVRIWNYTWLDIKKKKKDMRSCKVYQNKKWAMKKKIEKSLKKENQNIIWEI